MLYSIAWPVMYGDRHWRIHAQNEIQQIEKSKGFFFILIFVAIAFVVENILEAWRVKLVKK